jgi:hypothetical protein
MVVLLGHAKIFEKAHLQMCDMRNDAENYPEIYKLLPFSLWYIRVPAPGG